jgi:hypothetical protein
MNNLDRAEHERLATGAEFALHRYTVDDLQKNILLRFNEVFRDLRSESRESQWNLLS